MKAKYIISALCLLICTILGSASTPKVIAHRGYWKVPGSAQNSIRALVKADSIGCFASEFDVWMTTDSVLVVNHDGDINGVIIESSPSDIVMQQKLQNNESIPTLDDFLAAAESLDVNLILELKVHDNRSMEKEALKKSIDLIDKHGLNDRVTYITFSKDAYKQFIGSTPEDTEVYYLEGDYIPQQIKESGGAGIDYHLGVLKQHPEWIDECHDLGLLVNAWTIDKPDDMKWCIEHNVDFITTNEPEVLQCLLSSNKK